jgi:hypothetical protein
MLGCDWLPKCSIMTWLDMQLRGFSTYCSAFIRLIFPPTFCCLPILSEIVFIFWLLLL